MPAPNDKSKISPGLSLLDLGSSLSPDLGAKLGRRSPTSDLNTLSSRSRNLLARDLVRQAVRERPDDGTTVSEVCARTGLAEKTVRSHLETLTKLREVYRHKRSANTVIYFPNGKPMHGIKKERLECSNGDTLLELHVAQGRRDELFLHVVEKRFSLIEGEVTEGGVIIPLANVPELLKRLEKMYKENHS